MDLIFAAAIALLAVLVLVLVAIFTKKTKKQVLYYALAGIVIGIPAGYLLAPVIISFM